METIQVIHQTGSIDQTDWKHFYQALKIPALTFSYHESLEDYYLLADLIISRGGAGTLFELEFFKKQTIIIPIKAHAGNHQVENAQAMVKRNQKLFTLCDQDLISHNLESFHHLVVEKLR